MYKEWTEQTCFELDRFCLERSVERWSLCWEKVTQFNVIQLVLYARGLQYFAWTVRNGKKTP